MDDRELAKSLAGDDLKNKIMEWAGLAPGEFSVMDVDRDFGVQAPEQRRDRTVALEKLVEGGSLERVGKRRGWYRPRQNSLIQMDYQNCSEEALPFVLPLDLNRYVYLMPGNIVIIAGEPNAGKTGFLLNIVKENQSSFDIHYFNSEMGGGELKGRLKKFSGYTLDMWDFKAYSRYENFADVIFPDSVNIIDFLEVHDEFWKVGAEIRLIHQRLETGLAIIALQKDKGKDEGRGGQFTLEKARLALAMKPGMVKIVKAKSWMKPDYNPNGLQRRFKLRQGCEFWAQDKWFKDIEA